MQSFLDNKVYAVDDYIESIAKDPDFVEYTMWSDLEPAVSGFTGIVRYRAKNSFGGYVIETKEYQLTNGGTVVYFEDLDY